MSKERDKFLTELMGRCYHDWNALAFTTDYICQNCKAYGFVGEQIFNFDSWEGFGKLWQFSQQQCWWADFHSCYNRMGYIGYLNEIMVHPRNFADILYEYHKG